MHKKQKIVLFLFFSSFDIVFSLFFGSLLYHIYLHTNVVYRVAAPYVVVFEMLAKGTCEQVRVTNENRTKSNEDDSLFGYVSSTIGDRLTGTSYSLFEDNRSRQKKGRERGREYFCVVIFIQFRLHENYIAFLV